MKRWLTWLLGVVLAVLLLAAGAVLLLARWTGSDDFRQRVEREAGAAIGVPVTIAALSVDLWPVPAVAADGLKLATQPPLTLQRIEARPVWRELLAGRLKIATLVVRNAVLPQAAIGAVAAARARAAGARPAAPPAPAGEAGAPLALVPRRILLDGVTWIDAKGQPLTFDAQARLADDDLVESVQLKIKAGRFAGSDAALALAEGARDRWTVLAHLGGGTIAGELRIQADAKAGRVLTGQLATQQVEVSALTAPSRTLTGKLQAQTQLRAPLRDPSAIADVLRTQTTFTVRDAVVHGLDLLQAVKTVGLSKGGETALQTLAGQLVTQGRVAHLNNLVATSGALSATGNVSLAADRSLGGKLNVAVAATQGTVGVPLQVGGNLDAPSVTLSRGALVGAAIGTVIAPGAGTGAGAQLGDRIGERFRSLFGK